MSDWNTKIIDEFHAKGGHGVTHFGDRLLLLTTRGAHTGKSYTKPLAFHVDAGRYVVAASKAGAPTHPDWYYNLVASGEAEIEVGLERVKVRATPLPGGPERDRLYDQHAQLMPGFREYPTLTPRVIPIVLLERVEEIKAA